MKTSLLQTRWSNVSLGKKLITKLDSNQQMNPRSQPTSHLGHQSGRWWSEIGCWLGITCPMVARDWMLAGTHLPDGSLLISSFDLDHQRNATLAAIRVAFHWRADSGPFLLAYWGMARQFHNHRPTNGTAMKRHTGSHRTTATKSIKLIPWVESHH